MKTLDSKILSFIKSDSKNQTAFDQIALEVFQYQFENNVPYQKFLQTKDVNPKTIRHYTQIPPLPTLHFKNNRLATFPPSQTVATFHTSGTTVENCGVHEMDTLELYETSLIQSFETLIPFRAPSILSLTPSPIDTPRSSLAHMVQTLARSFCHSNITYVVENGQVNVDKALQVLKQAQQDKQPLWVFTTTVALHDFLLSIEQKKISISLPTGSFLFETGGKKGRRSVLSTQQLASLTETHLGIPQSHFCGEYGMTELSSPSWGRLEKETIVYQSPDWAPIRIVHPISMEEVSVGEEGLVSVFDLANRGSVSSLLTGDWGKRTQNGFTLLGRAMETELRGCALLTKKIPKEFLSGATANLAVISSAKERVLATPTVSASVRTDALNELTKRWVQPDYPQRKNFETTLVQAGLFSAGSITEGLNRTFQALENLSEDHNESSGLHIQISAGNLPVTGVFHFYKNLLSGVPSIHRPSSRGGALLSLLHQDLQQIHPALAKRTAIVETSSSNDTETELLLRGAESVFIQGDDETIEHIAQLAPASAKIFREGEKFSLVVITQKLTDKEMDLLAQDIFIWEQLGCLSPQAIFLLGDSAELAKNLQTVANKRAREWNRKLTPRSQGALIYNQIENVLHSEHLSIGLFDEFKPDFFSLPGFIQIIAFPNMDRLLAPIHAWSKKINAVATHSKIEITQNIKKVGLGQLQSPEFGGHTTAP